MPDIYTADAKEEGSKKKPLGESKSAIPLEIANEASINPLKAFRANPVGVTFGIQEPEEKIILLLRKHWITNVPWLLLAVVLIISPLLLRFVPLLDFLPDHYQLMALILWYFLVTAFIFEQFLTWFFNVYVITDERTIDVDFYNLIYKQITEAKNDKIQDTTYQVGGVIRSLFNYGNVIIQTAGAIPNLEFEAVPNPDKVVRVLNQLREQEEIEALEGRVR